MPEGSQTQVQSGHERDKDNHRWFWCGKILTKLGTGINDTKAGVRYQIEAPRPRYHALDSAVSRD